jgi:hypothetical protein
MGADGLGLYVYNVGDSIFGVLRIEARHCSDAACANGTTSILDTSPSSSQQVAAGDLAVGGDGLGLFVLERFDGDFMAHCVDTVCSSVTRAPATTGDTIAIGPDGLAVMSHNAGGVLSFSHCDDADCAAQTFSTPIDVGASAFASLSVGTDGLALIAYRGGDADLKVAHCSLTSCLAPGPKLLVSDAAVTEGDAGTTDVGILVTLSEPSAAPVGVDWQTDATGATATSGVDFLPASGALVFAPGELSQVVTVPVLGDTGVEPDEFLFVRLSNATGALIQDDSGRLTIVDDDAPSLSSNELAHGSVQGHDLQAQPGPVADRDYFRLGQPPWSSWEVVADATSGDVPPVVLQRLAADNTTVLQSGTPVTGGASVALRWSNASAFPALNQHVLVESGGCGASCDASAVYRIRAWETTGRIARFNNSATQATIVLLENGSAGPTQGTLWFFDAAGALLASQPFALAPSASYVLDTRGTSALVGASGSVRVTHDGGYGALSGKAVALEPATGFTFDTPLTFRPR